MWRSGWWSASVSMISSCDEKELPHLLEHLLFSGIDATGEGGLEERMQALGGEWNAFTSNADTTFVIEAPAKNQRKVLDLLLALLTQTRIDDNAINAAKRVVEREDGGHYTTCNAGSIVRTSVIPRAINWPWSWDSNARSVREVDHLTREQLETGAQGLVCAEQHDPDRGRRTRQACCRPIWSGPMVRWRRSSLSEHPPLPEIQTSAAHERTLTHGFVGDGAKLHWLVPEPVLDDQHDETFDLLKDYLDWALYRQITPGPWFVLRPVGRARGVRRRRLHEPQRRPGSR